MRNFKRSVVMLAIAFGAVVYMQSHLGDALLSLVESNGNANIEIEPSALGKVSEVDSSVSLETKN
jgi:hypothetical protein